MTSILNLQASARLEGSITRMLSEATVTHLAADNVVTRNLSDGIKLLSSDWVAANSTPAAERNDAQRNALALSDSLINVEIFSYVTKGALEHKDTLGNGSIVVAGGSAGAGVSHSEFNPSQTDAMRFLQIWLIPTEKNTAPRYETYGHWNC